MQSTVLGREGKSGGSNTTPPPPTLRSTLGERTHIEIRKQREKKSESQCHGMAKSLGSEVPDNYIQISVTAGDSGEGLLTS